MLRRWHQRAKAARDRPHIAVRQLQPLIGEGVCEFLRVLAETTGDLLVGLVESEREVSCQYGQRMLLRQVKGDRNRAFTKTAFRLPLQSTSRTHGQLPLVAEEVREENVAPLGARLGPSYFEATGDGVAAGAAATAALPAKSLILERTPAGSLPTCLAFPAPWFVQNVDPLAISSTFSSSFSAMRRNVSRMSLAAISGSGVPFDPSSFT